MFGFSHVKRMLTVCEISNRPVDNVSVKSSWSMSNLKKKLYNVQWGLCKIENWDWSMIPQNLVSHTVIKCIGSEIFCLAFGSQRQLILLLIGSSCNFFLYLIPIVQPYLDVFIFLDPHIREMMSYFHETKFFHVSKTK